MNACQQLNIGISHFSQTLTKRRVSSSLGELGFKYRSHTRLYKKNIKLMKTHMSNACTKIFPTTGTVAFALWCSIF